MKYSYFDHETENSEFSLGIVSMLFGVWFWLPICHSQLNKLLLGINTTNQPEILGTLLLVSGLFKFIGLCIGHYRIRKLSCIIAAFVWFFITFVMLCAVQLCWCDRLSNPIVLFTTIFGLHNGAILLNLTWANK